jgi:hypothetical protein
MATHAKARLGVAGRKALVLSIQRGSLIRRRLRSRPTSAISRRALKGVNPTRSTNPIASAGITGAAAN